MADARIGSRSRQPFVLYRQPPAAADRVVSSRARPAASPVSSGSLFLVVLQLPVYVLSRVFVFGSAAVTSHLFMYVWSLLLLALNLFSQNLQALPKLSSPPSEGTREAAGRRLVTRVSGARCHTSTREQ